MKICVGIISYLPDDLRINELRLGKLITLLCRCDELFEIPIILIAQNYKNVSLPVLKNSQLIVYNYKNKLGITGARRELRKRFLESDFDYLIMLDDDSVLVGDRNDAKQYLTDIESHPGMYGVHKSLLLKLLAISKEIYSQVDFPEGEPENGDFFEDMQLMMTLYEKFSDKKYKFSSKLREESNSNDSKTSTQYHCQIDKRKMGDATRAMFKGGGK